MTWSDFKKFVFQFLLIFVSVLLAFSLTEWSSQQTEKQTEAKILAEINNGILSDLSDFRGNIQSHYTSQRAIEVFRDLLQHKPVPQDSIGIFYIVLLRNFTPIINTSGYESLKSSNLKTIKNDSLRFKIIALYDFHYKIIEKLEDQVHEMQMFYNYFAPINSILHAYMRFDGNGTLVGISDPVNITENNKKEILSYLWRIENNKNLKLKRYETVLLKIEELNKMINEELNL